MSAEDFATLVLRRNALEREHGAACAILEEEGTGDERCTRLYAELSEVQGMIDAEIADELAAEARSEPASEAPPAA